MTPITSAGRITHREFRIRGLRIHAQIQGEGEPLLMYSPIWSRAEVWAPLLPYLTGFRTIAFDPPGIGRSPMPTLPMTMQGLASVGTALLDELGIESAHVLGASFGGAVAQHMAICHPGRVRRLVLASTSFGAFAIPGHPRALWHIVRPGSHRGRMEEIAGNTFGGRLRTAPELVRAMPICSPPNIPAALYDMAPLAWLDEPAVAMGDPSAHARHLRRRRPDHAAGKPPDHGGAHSPCPASHHRGRWSPGADRQPGPRRADHHKFSARWPAGEDRGRSGRVITRW